VLNDAPRPADLPDAPTGYAALPPDYPPPAPGPSRAIAGQTPPPVRSSLRTVLAAVAVVALVAVAVLVAWRVTSPPPVATRTPSTVAPGPGGSAAPTPTPGRPVTKDYPAELAAFYTQTIDWSPCADNARLECGDLEVPVDYSKPTGDRFTLALRKAPATDPNGRLGSMLFNPGGPGVPGTEYADASSLMFSKRVRAAYDLVFFDPRGIGRSDQVQCLTDTDKDLLFRADPTPDSPAERQKVIADLDGVVSRCASQGGSRARHLSTAEVARDMDVMRVLLGDEKLNYFGVSYGTFLGAVYADTFPKKVGRMVLDSAMSPNQTRQQETAYDIQGFESSFDAFVDWCVARPGCSLGKDKSGARQKIADLLDDIERHGLVTSKPGLAKIGEGWAGFGILMSLYSDTFWPSLDRGLAQAFAGRGDILLAKAMSTVHRRADGTYAPDSYLNTFFAIKCSDWPRSRADGGSAAEARTRHDHPLWAKITGLNHDICASWPTAGRQPKGTTLAAGAGPILVIGNERDIATPIGGTKQLAKDLASGVLLTSDHDGHGTYYAGNSCVDSAVDGYLLRGTAPVDGTTC
jgi:pimeloyl-ACP methyl ester carboxylesterase